MIAGTKEIAGIFGVSPQAVHLWEKAGCPKLSRGRWDVGAVVRWWSENVFAERLAGDDESLAEAKRKYWTAKAEREGLRVATERGELVDLDTVHRGWARRMAEFKSGLYNFVESLPPLLEGRDQAAMRKTIDGQVWNMLDRVCREGQFCQRPALTDEQIIKLWREGYV